jgi:DNA-binding GntR family transcriptional regulator
MARTEAGGTKADEIHARLRADVLAGRLRPGQRLKFPDLIAAHGTSAGVLREALGRLVSQGLAQVQPHQGFVVTPLSHRDLQELTAARVALEVLVFRRAVEDGDLAWETRVLSAHHVLERTPMADPDAPGQLTDTWAAAHADFHRALLEGCPNRRLLEMALALREEAELYRRWSVSLGDEPDRDIAGEHRALRDAAVAREPERAGRLLAEHIEHTAGLLVTCATDEHVPRHQAGDVA